MPDSLQPTADTARQFAEFIRTPEGFEIISRAVDDAIARSGLVERRGLPSDEAAGMIRLLAARSGDNQEDVLLKALTLYGLALDAREKGNYLAILTPDDEIVREIRGFEPEEAGRPSGS